MFRWFVSILLLTFTGAALAQPAPGSQARPLRVVLIPADGGTESGTRADFQPLFNAVSRMTGLRFDLRVAQSYGSVVEAMCNGSADIAFIGPVTYVQAHKRRCAELLAVAVEKGRSIYYAGLFARTDSGIRSIKDLKGKKVAFGDINSTSSFVFPMSMILEAGLDPTRDLAGLQLTGSHTNSLAALVQRRVDVAALSFDSYEKAVRQGAVNPRQIKVVARSLPIPYPPLVVGTRLPAPLKARLKTAFQNVAKAPGVTPGMIRGYGGRQVDGYDTRFPAAKFNIAAAKMALISDGLKSDILKQSAQR